MQLARTTQKSVRPEACDKPDGGFLTFKGEQLLIVVWLLNQKLLSALALRAFLGFAELRGERMAGTMQRRAQFREWDLDRRGPRPKPIKPRYAALPELEIRTRIPRRKLTHALKELERLNIVRYSDEVVLLAPSIDGLALTEEQKAEFQRFAQAHHCHRRRTVPFGRRMLNYLANGAENAKNLPAYFGVVVGLTLRGAYYHARNESPYHFAGWARNDWLAKLVGTSERTVQRVKRRLDGWYLPQATAQWATNQYGERFHLSPTWERPDKKPAPAAPLEPSPEKSPETSAELSTEQERRGLENASQPSPRPAPNAPQLSWPSPPVCDPTVGAMDNKKSPYGTIKNQDNKISRPEGEPKTGPDFLKHHSESKNPPPESDPPPPRLSAIRPELDFTAQGTPRLLELLRQAQKCGVIGHSEHSRLCWIAAACRAMSHGKTRNPAGVFLKLVKGKHFGHLSDEDFDEANRRLKDHLFAPPSRVLLAFPMPAMPTVLPPSRPKLSQDALTLKVIKNKAGLRDVESAFPALRVQGWDRTRFVSAKRELEASPPVVPIGMG